MRKAPAWPALTPEVVPIAQLANYKNNPRTHSQTQIAQLARSLKTFGWTNAVLRDEHGTLIAGHGRIAAAKLLSERGEKDFLEAPVITARGWSKDQIRAYVIADNQLALQAGWDPGLLTMELKELSGAGFDMNALGFGGAELSRLMGNHTNDAAEATPAKPPAPVSRLGDLWHLGKHRILCGDSTDSKAVALLLGDKKPVLMVTDPPYGVEYDPNWRNSVDRSTMIKGRKIGATAVGKVQNDDRADWQAAWALFPGDVAYVWHAGLHASEVDLSLKAAGFEVRSQIIWNKTCHIIGRGDYHWKHEPCWYAVRKGKPGHFDRRERKQNTVWDIDHRASDSGHGTQKPVECMRRPIVNNSAEGDAVYDPFLGSGTTLIAAQMEGRVAYGLELDPAYVDVIVLRYNKFSGKEATLGGKTYEQVQRERNGKARTKEAANKPGGDRGRGHAPAPDKRAKTTVKKQQAAAASLAE
jgi:DNA modification methylase